MTQSEHCMEGYPPLYGTDCARILQYPFAFIVEFANYCLVEYGEAARFHARRIVRLDDALEFVIGLHRLEADSSLWQS